MSKQLVFEYGDGSQKLFSFSGGNSISELFQLAKATRVGLNYAVWPDRGEKDILAFEIDGHGHPNPGRWVVTRNGTDSWPDMSGFAGGPLEDGDRIVFTLKDEP